MASLLFQIYNWFLPSQTRALQTVENKPTEVKHGATYAQPLGIKPGYSPGDAMSAYAGHGYTYAAVSRASQDLAALPLRLLRGKERALVEEHPAIDLMENPSTNEDGYLFREQLATDLILTGNCYILILGQTETPVSIVRLHPQNVRISTDQTGVKGYIYESGGQRVIYPPDRVVHGRLASWSNGPDQLLGTGCIEPLNRELHADINSQNLVSNASAKARPDLLISPSDPADIWGPEMRREIASEYKKLSASGGAMVLSGLAKVEPLKLTPREMEYSRAREMARESISAVTGVPPSVLGLPSANYALSRQQARNYWSVQTKRGKRLAILFSEIAKRFDPELKFEHDYSGVEALQESRTEQLQRVQMHIMNGISGRDAYKYEGLDYPSDIVGSEADNVDETAEDVRSHDEVLVRFLSGAITKQEDEDLSTYENRREAFASLNESTQKALKKKAEEHEEEVGDDPRKQTDEFILAVSYLRGIGAYQGSPASVRPGVGSAEQWAMGRVNGLLYALKNLKFRRSPYDTDLLPEDHPLSTRGEDKQNKHLLYGYKGLDKAPKETDWGFTDREAEELLGEDDFDQYSDSFLFVYKGREDEPNGYRLPIAKMIDGRPQVVFRGVIAAGSSLRKEPKFGAGFYNLDGISDRDIRRLYNVIEKLYEEFGEVAPELEEKAVGDVDPTNFPTDSDDEEVGLKNSNFRVFDYEYAQDLKENWPQIWKAGGNIEGNNQFRRLSPIVRRESQEPTTETEEMAVRKREAWAARHFEDGAQFNDEEPPSPSISTVAGIVAQVKWFVVGALGEAKMKQVLDEVKAKETQEKARKDLWNIYIKQANDPAFKDLNRAARAYLSGAAKRYKKRIEENVTPSLTKGVTDFSQLLAFDTELRIAKIIIGEPWKKHFRKSGTNEMSLIFGQLGVSSEETPPLSEEGLDDFVTLFCRPLVRTRTDAVGNLVTQGLLEGLPIDTIANNILSAHAFDFASARLIALTESTKATNLGTQEAFKQAAGFGIRLRKQWLSSRNSDVRDTHADLDGQIRGINEEFETFTGVTGVCPGSMADMVENYNCRCSMISIVDDDQPTQGWSKPVKCAPVKRD